MLTREVRLDRKKLEYLRVSRGWTVDDLVKNANLAKKTLLEAMEGQPKNIKTAWLIARAFGFNDLIPLLDEKELTAIGPPSTWNGAAIFFAQVNEWDVGELVVPLVTIANGLQYEVCRLRHRHRPDRFARGKCFDLSRTSAELHSRLREHLERHVEVCERLAKDAHIARNLTVSPDSTGQYWWVIDEWVPGSSLDTLLEETALPNEEIPCIMREIAEGLQGLHREKIFLRELSPEHVHIRDGDRTVILTDFELAKLTDGSPTVSPKGRWPNDEYRALEVGGPVPIDATADLYSWGRILAHVLTGTLPPRGHEAKALESVKLPPAVRQIAIDCVALPRSDRPKSIDAVLNAVRRWK